MINKSNECVQLQPVDGDRLIVWLDSPGRSVNLVDAHMLAALEAAVEHVANSDRLRLVVFRSRKEDCFFAGADVKAIASLKDKDEVQAIIERGQRLMQRVGELPVVTVAAIDGICMGGGLEFAMACNYRVASDSSKTKLGLPEIRLGLIPGWGGTQRLPRLVGLRQALAMILKGSTVTSSKAKRIGLVDRVLDHANFDQGLQAFINDVGTSPASKRRLGMQDRLWDRTAIGRKFVLYMARRKIASQRVHYPALAKAIDAVSMSGRRTCDGYQFECEAFAELLFTPTAQSLLGLFMQRDRAKKPATWLTTYEPPDAPVNRSMAVIGAGAMGAGIGALAAQKGIQVIFKEINDSAAKAGAARVEHLLREQFDQHRISESEMGAALSRTSFTTKWQDLSRSELAIEAVLEVDSVKREVFQMLDRTLPGEAVLVSNTSSLSVTQMAAATVRKAKVAGLHFFNPVDRMELVEVVRTEMTDDATVCRLLDLVRRLGKTPIVTSDKPGFLVNRVLFPYLGEAVRMVAEGFDVQSIDGELRRFGMPMGPLELIDQVGVDIASHVANSLSRIQTDAEVPAAFLAQMAEKKWLGKKANIGFYLWKNKRKPNPGLPKEVLSTAKTGDFAPDGLTDTQRRLVYPMLNEAIHCLDELVVTDPWMVDLGMVLGTGFAPMTGGPLRMVDLLGAKAVYHNMQILERAFGNRFASADGLVSLATRGDKFFSSDSVSESLAWENQDASRCTTES